ncbi:hypothetical protein EGH24_13925 [Halonotius terrestris]|uniref:DUF7123 domain-containing protein n=1 Tax=Halonotius terrestris TaxID=2487750 RepID=A0A8J8P7J9_9EURY|nr:hypothetical protein [Halonotius terrestris]TQQ78616.1 hypothetical protein EGH24_13925 [Halonotius terrestris]
MSSEQPRCARVRAKQRNTTRRRRKIARYLLGRLSEPDASLYIKAREIAADTGFSSREVGDALAQLEEAPAPVTARKLTSSTPTTWQVVRE